MEFLKSSYFQTVPHNGLGYQLSLIMVSQPNHLLREYFGSIGYIYICMYMLCLYNTLLYIYDAHILFLAIGRPDA